MSATTVQTPVQTPVQAPAPAKTTKKKTKTGKRGDNRQKKTYQHYIARVNKEQGDGTRGISRTAMKIFNGLVHDLFTKIVSTSKLLADEQNKQTLTEKEIECAIRLHMDQYLASDAMQHGQDAVRKYEKSIVEEEAKMMI